MAKRGAEDDRVLPLAAQTAAVMQRSWADLRNANQISALADIEGDIENIRAAWRYDLSEKNSRELLKFMDSFWVVYDIRGWNQSAISLFEEAAGQLHLPAEDDAERLVHAKALGFLGFFTGVIGNPEQGLTLSQEALALKANVDRTFVSQIERGIRQPTLTTLCKLAGALEIQPSTLIVRVERMLK